MLYLNDTESRDLHTLTEIILRERKAYPKEFKLMRVELSYTRPFLMTLAKELNINVTSLY
jgi:hypothetical protein